MNDRRRLPRSLTRRLRNYFSAAPTSTAMAPSRQRNKFFLEIRNLIRIFHSLRSLIRVRSVWRGAWVLPWSPVSASSRAWTPSDTPSSTPLVDARFLFPTREHPPPSSSSSSSKYRLKVLTGFFPLCGRHFIIYHFVIKNFIRAFNSRHPGMLISIYIFICFRIAFVLLSTAAPQAICSRPPLDNWKIEDVFVSFSIVYLL